MVTGVSIIAALHFHIWTFFHYKKKNRAWESLGAGFLGSTPAPGGLSREQPHAWTEPVESFAEPLKQGNYVRLMGSIDSREENQSKLERQETEKGQEDEAGIPKMVLVLAGNAFLKSQTSQNPKCASLHFHQLQVTLAKWPQCLSLLTKEMR